MLATIALGFTRLSALFWYRRIFVNRTKKGIFGPVTIFFIVFVCIWTITFIGIDAGVCGKAVSAYPPNPKCFYDWYVIIFALTSFILDVLVVFLPIPMVSCSSFLCSLLNIYSRYGFCIPLSVEKWA